MLATVLENIYVYKEMKCAWCHREIAFDVYMLRDRSYCSEGHRSLADGKRTTLPWELLTGLFK